VSEGQTERLGCKTFICLLTRVQGSPLSRCFVPRVEVESHRKVPHALEPLSFMHDHVFLDNYSPPEGPCPSTMRVRKLGRLEIDFLFYRTEVQPQDKGPLRLRRVVLHPRPISGTWQGDEISKIRGGPFLYYMLYVHTNKCFQTCLLYLIVGFFS
jgi:hypothetical protein